MNCLTNAVKYTAVGGRVDVSVIPLINKLSVVVTDTGSLGIAPGEDFSISRIRPARRGIGPAGRPGTALALCQRLMHAMGGEIGVDSRVGKGSAFWIELPAASSPLKRLPEKQRHAASRGCFRLPVRRILYIEDNLSNLTLVEQCSRSSTNQLITAIAGRSWLDLALETFARSHLARPSFARSPRHKVCAQFAAGMNLSAPYR